MIAAGAAPALAEAAAQGRGDLIALIDVTIAYDRHPVVHHLDGAFRSGSATALIGPNGAGKSSLLRAIAGLLPLASGRIAIAPGTGIAYLPQVTAIDRQFPISALDVVNLGHWHRIGAWRPLAKTAIERSRRALADVGLAGFADTPIAALSVGQFQRVLFARLIVEDQSLILLDEPFNAVDAETTSDLLQILERWQREGRTLVAALHDLDLVRRHMPETLLLAREPIAWGPTDLVLTPENLAAAASAAGSWNAPAGICRI